MNRDILLELEIDLHQIEGTDPTCASLPLRQLCATPSHSDGLTLGCDGSYRFGNISAHFLAMDVTRKRYELPQLSIQMLLAAFDLQEKQGKYFVFTKPLRILGHVPRSTGSLYLSYLHKAGCLAVHSPYSTAKYQPTGWDLTNKGRSICFHFELEYLKQINLQAANP